MSGIFNFPQSDLYIRVTDNDHSNKFFATILCQNQILHTTHMIFYMATSLDKMASNQKNKHILHKEFWFLSHKYILQEEIYSIFN